MSFLRGTEEYYQKFIELQEKLRRSEEERLVLEMKFNEMVQVTREEEQAYYRKLRNQYKRFLDEDRRRQERNERIIRVIERIESRAGMLAAKTERFELLRQQYLAYLRRVFYSSRQDQQPIQPPQIPEEIPTILEEKSDLYDHPVIQKALYGDRLANYSQGDDLYKHPVIKKALFGDKDEKKSNPKLDVVNQYLRSLSTPISGEEVLKATRSSQKMSRPRELSDSNESNPYGDEYSFYKSNAGTIADKIINSINSKPKLSTSYHSKYDNKISEKDSLYRPVEDTFCSTKTSPRRFNSGKIDDVEVFKYPADSMYSNIEEDERKDKERLKKTEVRFEDFDYASNVVPTGFSKEESKNYGVKNYLSQTENCTKDVSAEEEQGMVQNLESENVAEEDVRGDKHMYSAEQYEEPEVYLYKNNEQMANTADNDNINESMKDRDYIEQTLDKVQSLASEAKQELDTSALEEKEKMEDEKDVYNETIESDEISRDTANEERLHEYNTDYAANVTENIEEDTEYYKRQHEETIPNVKGNERNENQPYYQEYDVNGQPISYYNENDKSNVECDENIQLKDVDHGPQAEIQPGNEYNKDQDNVQDNHEQEEIVENGERNMDSPSKFEKDQHEESEHHEINKQIEVQRIREETKSADENDQPVAQYDDSTLGQYDHGETLQYNNDVQPLLPYDQSHMQYNENGQYNEAGQPIMQYDENGQAILQYDENGQPIMMQYDENGQPIMQYDQNGQPIMMQYNENGQPIMMQYDEHGQPIMQYDQNGQPMMNYDQNGQPIPQYDEHGQPILYDGNGQPMMQYDENGQPIYQYGQGDGYYQDNQPYVDNIPQQQHYEERENRIENTDNQSEVEKSKNVDAKESVPTDRTNEQTTKDVDSKEVVIEKSATDATKQQTTKNVDLKEEKPAGDAIKKQTTKTADTKEAAKEKPAADPGKKQTPPPKNSEKKPNVMEMLDTDTESIKQDTKVSNDSDFDFSNS